MNQVEQLNRYKSRIILLGKTVSERKFIESSFTRWYFIAPRKDLIPSRNVVIRKDLVFANSHKGCNFDVKAVCDQSAIEFKQLAEIKIDKKEKYPNKDHLISRAQLERLAQLYTKNSFENDKNKLIAIYEFVGMNSAHLSIPPTIFTDIKPIECFGSPLNTSNLYCSPFAFEKQRFGSLGSFFNFKLADCKHGLFTANPPFDEDIMMEMARHLLRELARSKTPKTVIVTIPVWDSASQRKLGVRDFGMRFEAYEMLTSSEFTKEYDILEKEAYPYWDYYAQTYAPVSYTHLIILATTPLITMREIKERWRLHGQK